MGYGLRFMSQFRPLIDAPANARLDVIRGRVMSRVDPSSAPAIGLLEMHALAALAASTPFSADTVERSLQGHFATRPHLTATSTPFAVRSALEGRPRAATLGPTQLSVALDGPIAGTVEPPWLGQRFELARVHRDPAATSFAPPWVPPACKRTQGPSTPQSWLLRARLTEVLEP
jgi:hypothetical protein